MAKTYEEDKQVLEQLLDDWEKDSVVDKTQPNNSCAEISRLHAKYLKVLARNTVNIHAAEDDYLEMKRLRTFYYDGSITQDELTKQKWQQYLGKSPKISAQMEALLASDPFLIEINKRKKIYQLIVDSCEKILKEINSKSYSIPAYMSWELKIRQG